MALKLSLRATLLVALTGLALQISSAVQIEYDFHVKTSNSMWSGTDEDMAYQFIGINDGVQVITNSIKYVGSWSMFERGSYDRVKLWAEDVGALTAIKVTLKNSGSGYVDQWTLDYIRINLHGTTYVANFYKTFKKNNQYHYDDSLSIESCPNGFDVYHNSTSGATYCQDRDECSSTCNGIGESCLNTVGSFICNCKSGFSRVGSDCTDIDECLDPAAYSCPHANTVCSNTIGSYQCKCKTGYQGDPANCADYDECSNFGDNKCSHICVNDIGTYHCTCRNGYTISPDGKTCTDLNECAAQNQCNNATSVCYDEFGSYRCQCRPGYKNPINNKKVCEKIGCSALNYLSDPNIVINPSSCAVHDARKFGDKCHFTCKSGYYLDVRTAVDYVCTSDGYWKGLYPPKCLPTLCPALSTPANGFYIPSGCGTKGAQHNKKCTFYCNYGYRLVGDNTFDCAFKRYNKDPANTQCVKVPSIRCPGDVKVYLTGADSAVPLSNLYKSHTSNMRPDQVTSQPANMGPSHLFGVGVHTVRFTATNSVGDKAECSYRVTVVDKSAPIAEFCPSDLYLTSTGSHINVSWTEPRFTDNIGVTSVESTVKNGLSHPPTTFSVFYKAKDARRQEAKCSFTVNIKLLRCEVGSLPFGDQTINRNCFSITPTYALCTAECAVNKTFTEVSATNPLKNYWNCKNAVIEGFERIPDCVDFIPVKSGGGCDVGYVPTKDYRSYPLAHVCGKCPRGTHYATATKSCIDCPKGTYNNKEGQTSCTSCPSGTSSTVTRSIDSSGCVALCPPGTSSRSGFNDHNGCSPCPVNHYQASYGSVTCDSCPPTSYTLGTGARSIDRCLRAPAIVHITPLPKIDATEGDDVTFDCASDGTPEPLLRWDKLTSAQPAAQDIGVHTKTVHQNSGGVKFLRYTITGAKPSDSGSYRCKAENSQGDAKGTLQLTVTAQSGSGALG